MRISVLAVGTRLKPWVYEGFDNYAGRMPPQLRVDLVEIPAGSRSGRGTGGKAREVEADQLLSRAGGADRTIALDERGLQWDSRELSAQMKRWLEEYPRIALLIGGPDGLSGRCRSAADQLWSLSSLTLPHGLVRIVLVEQLYRAWTILQGHPYHRS